MIAAQAVAGVVALTLTNPNPNPNPNPKPYPNPNPNPSPSRRSPPSWPRLPGGATRRGLW